MSTASDDNLVFRALANETRRAILDALRAGPLTTGALCAMLPALERTTVMQHLGVLVEADLVIVERRGRERWNHLNALPIQAIHERWIGSFAGYTADKLGQLGKTLDAK